MRKNTTRDRNIKDAVTKFGSINDAKLKLANCCIERLNISYAVYNCWINALQILPNHDAKIEDKKLFKNEKFIKKICKSLKINKEKLKTRLINYGFIPSINSNELQKLRKIFGIKLDRSKLCLHKRTPEQKALERKVIILFNRGFTYREMSEKLNKPQGSVIQYVNRIRNRNLDSIMPLRPPGGWIRPDGYTPENISKLLKSGKTVKEIAKMFGKKVHSMNCTIIVWRKKYPNAEIPYIKKIIK